MARSARVPSSESAVDANLVEIVERVAERLQAGQSIEIDQVIADHPDYAERLRHLLPAMLAAADLGLVSSPAVDSMSPPIAYDGPPKHVGEFRLIREIGRGGMGIVYEAEQESLGRRVALKVLPMAAILDPRQLQRFKNEAKAAATLHHTHIVPVHSVGCDRGVHYFAMQYIDGLSLEALIRQLRRGKRERAAGGENPPPDSPRYRPGEIDKSDPAQPQVPLSENLADTAPLQQFSTAYAHDRRRFYQQVARWAIDAAEALEHAHFHGIVHRDIKPANLLVDTAGRLWVTDFGLARLEAETGITMTGDVMGTLRYMSPEQSAGNRHVIDPRCDIYSLGATFYELLTLYPVFPAQDRPKLLRQIAEQEPRRPRSIDPGIPPDLETILLKTMQKGPDDRYLSAQDLADDLRRFLKQESIQAKRPTRLVRALRWSRRHFESLTAVAATLILTLLLAAGLLTHAYRQENRQRIIAEQQRERANAHLKMANNAVDTMYTRFADEWLESDVAMSGVQQEFLERAAAFYDQLSDQEVSDPALQFSMANAKIRLGRLYNGMGKDSHRGKAEEVLQQALMTLQRLSPPVSEDPKYPLAMAACHYELQRALTGKGADPQHRLSHLQTAREILAARLRDDPADDAARLLLSVVIVGAGVLQDHLEEFAQAKQLFLEARQQAEQIRDRAKRQRSVAGCNHCLSLLPSAFFSNDEKEETLRSTVDACREMRLENPRHAATLENLASALNNLAAFRFRRSGNVEEATALYEETANILLELVHLVPDNDQVSKFLIRTAGNVNFSATRAGPDVATWQRAIGVLERILDGCVNNTQRAALLGYLADAYSRLAVTLGDEGRVSEALQTAEQCQEVLAKREPLVPTDRWASLYVALASANLCQLYVEQRLPVEAYQLGLSSVQHAQRLLWDAFAEPEKLADKNHRRIVMKNLNPILRNCVLLCEAWGPESLRQACLDAVAVNRLAADDIWLLQGMAESQLGNFDPLVDRIAPMIEQQEPRPAEILVWAFAQLAEWLLVDDHQDAVYQLTQNLIARREAKVGAGQWRCPDLAAATYVSLAQTQHTLGNWQRVIEDGDIAIVTLQQCREQKLSEVNESDIRQLIGRSFFMRAHAHDQQRAYDAACQDASQAITYYRDYLVDAPQDRTALHERSQVLMMLSEANYYAGRTDDARRSHDETLQDLRDLIAAEADDGQLQIHRKLTGLLTRSPLASPETIAEAQQISGRMLQLKPDNPAVWYETAWMSYRRSDLEAAGEGFTRYITWHRNATQEEQDELAPKARNCLDGVREKAAERYRMTLAGLALTESGLGHVESAKEHFDDLLRDLRTTVDAACFSLLEYNTLLEAARSLDLEAALPEFFYRAIQRVSASRKGFGTLTLVCPTAARCR